MAACLSGLHLSGGIVTELEGNWQLTIIPGTLVNPLVIFFLSRTDMKHTVFDLEVTRGDSSLSVNDKNPGFSRQSGEAYLEKASSSPSSTSCQDINQHPSTHAWCPPLVLISICSLLLITLFQGGRNDAEIKNQLTDVVRQWLNGLHN